MNGTGYPVQGCGPREVAGWFSFDINSTSDPSTSSFVGSLKRYVSTVTYATTGKFVITFTTDFRFPTFPRFVISSVCADATTNGYVAVQLGAYDTTNRQLTVQMLKPNNTAFQAATPAAASSTGAASIVIDVKANNSAGL